MHFRIVRAGRWRRYPNAPLMKDRRPFIIANDADAKTWLSKQGRLNNSILTHIFGKFAVNYSGVACVNNRWVPAIRFIDEENITTALFSVNYEYEQEMMQTA